MGTMPKFDSAEDLKLRTTLCCYTCGLELPPETCLESVFELLCIDGRAALPCTDDVPCEIGLCGIMCMSSDKADQTLNLKTACCCNSCAIINPNTCIQQQGKCICLDCHSACLPTNDIPCGLACCGVEIFL